MAAMEPARRASDADVFYDADDGDSDSDRSAGPDGSAARGPAGDTQRPSVYYSAEDLHADPPDGSPATVAATTPNTAALDFVMVDDADALPSVGMGAVSTAPRYIRVHERVVRSGRHGADA
jgi:hypothetical protein